jgi:hypothetical protein
MYLSSETDESGAPSPSSEPSLLSECRQSTFRALSLDRLGALMQLREAARDDHARDDQGNDAVLHRHLIDRAIFSVYEDCIAAGARDAAQELLTRGQRTEDREQGRGPRPYVS